MNENQRRLYGKLRGGDSLELLPGGQVSESSGIKAQINQIVGNPAFKAEVTLQFFVRYYNAPAAVGTPAAIVPAAGQQTALPLYVFGNIDRAANYARARQAVPGGGGWNYAGMAILDAGDGHCGRVQGQQAAASVEFIAGSYFFGLTLPGDLVFIIPIVGDTIAPGATTVQAEIIIRCPNVPYTSLLSALNSDLVTLNMIRYVVPVANVAQLAQQMTFLKGSLFGKLSADTLDPQTFITPGTFQPQIADIPITLPIDKNLTIATQIIYTAVVPMLFSWTLTVSSIDKLSYA